MLRAIFFDMGGTLDGDGHWLDRFVRLYAERGIGIPREAIRRGFDYAEQRAAVDADIVSADMESLVRCHLAWQFEVHDLQDADLYTQMLDGFLTPIRLASRRNSAMLEALRRRGFVLGVVSNACGNAQALCDDLGYSEHLSLVVDSRVVGVAKPNPQIYRIALQRIGVDAPSAMMVGDSYERDVVPAHHLGMQTTWLVHAGIPAATGVSDHCITTLEHFPTHLVATERASA